MKILILILSAGLLSACGQFQSQVQFSSIDGKPVEVITPPQVEPIAPIIDIEPIELPDSDPIESEDESPIVDVPAVEDAPSEPVITPEPFPVPAQDEEIIVPSDESQIDEIGDFKDSTRVCKVKKQKHGRKYWKCKKHKRNRR